MDTICWNSDTSTKIENIKNQILIDQDKWVILQVSCSTRIFQNKVKSTSDFYRKLSNGKSSFGSVPNRVFWSSTVDGGFYVSNTVGEKTNILMCLGIKKTGSFGLTLQLMSRIKKILPFCTIEVGGPEQLQSSLIKEYGLNKIQFVGVYYYPINLQNSVG